MTLRNPVDLNAQQRLHFRDEFRDGRRIALQDAEGCQAILFALERFTAFVTGTTKGLANGASAVSEVAAGSALARDLPADWPEWHTPVSQLLDRVRRARNHAFHEGAFARHLTSDAVTLALILEDALMVGIDQVGDYMIRQPVCAQMWQPLAFVRQTLLANSFSFLPVNVAQGSQPNWSLVSDASLAAFTRTPERKARLRMTLREAVEGGLTLSAAFTCQPRTSIADALTSCQGRPILVVNDEGALLGLATPFDLL